MTFLDDVEWCCIGFEANYRSAGRRGIGVLVDCPDGTPRFNLQFRAINPDDTSQVPSTPFPLTLGSEVGMRFCPWCGAALARQYPRRVAEKLSRPGLKIRVGG